MEGSGETECSKLTDDEGKYFIETSPFEKITDEMKDGGSSSNSTVEEIEKKAPSVRPYVRSKMPRLRWTSDLHQRFVNAVERLGGEERATPKLVLHLMNIKGLHISHVKSHLQMFRSKKTDEPNQGMMDQRIFMDCTDRNIYNLSQLPFLPTFNQGHNSSLTRFRDASWTSGHGKWTNNLNIVTNMGDIMKPVFCSPLTQRILNNHYIRSSNIDPCSTMNEEPTWLTNKSINDKFGNLKRNPICHDIYHNQNGIKRKASDWGLDLDLAIGQESRSEGSVLQDDDNILSLSLHTHPSSLKKKKVKEDFVCANARGVSTLDLTL